MFGIRGIQIHQPGYWPLQLTEALIRSEMPVVYAFDENGASPLAGDPSKNSTQALIELLRRASAITFPSAKARELTARQLSFSLGSARIIRNDGRAGAAYRDLYADLGMMPTGSRIPPRELLDEVFAHQEPESSTSTGLAMGASRDRPRYQSSAWYPTFLKLKPFVPKAIRNWGRRVLLRLEKARALPR